MTKSERSLKKRMRLISKLPLDDDEENLVCKRRFMSKNYSVSKQWSRFSSEWCIDLTPNGRDMFGVNKEEYMASQEGHMINRENWYCR